MKYLVGVLLCGRPCRSQRRYSREQGKPCQTRQQGFWHREQFVLGRSLEVRETIIFFRNRKFSRALVMCMFGDGWFCKVVEATEISKGYFLKARLRILDWFRGYWGFTVKVFKQESNLISFSTMLKTGNKSPEVLNNTNFILPRCNKSQMGW